MNWNHFNLINDVSEKNINNETTPILSRGNKIADLDICLNALPPLGLICL